MWERGKGDMGVFSVILKWNWRDCTEKRGWQKFDRAMVQDQADS